MTLNHLTTRVLALATLVVATACGPFRRNDPNNPPTLIVFTNQSLDQADVYAVTSANQRVRMGTVMAGHTDTLVVPNDIAARGENVNVVARLLAGSYMPSSGPIAIRRGESVQITLPVDQKLLVVLPGD